MQRAWRLCDATYEPTAFSGEGAFLAGGRWNRKGARCVYTSGSLALATLEALVHFGGRRPTIPYVSIEIEIPDGVAQDDVPADLLKAGWEIYPSDPALATFGSEWLAARRTAVLRVPSAVVANELNYILNPLHPDFAGLIRHAAQPYSFDRRFPPHA